MSETMTIVVHAVGMNHSHYRFATTNLLAVVHESANTNDKFAVKVVRTDQTENGEPRQVAYIGKEFRMSVLLIIPNIISVEYKKESSTSFKAVLEITFTID